jgi:hypothetical protein
MSNADDFIMIALVFGIPFLLGIGAIWGAVALFPKQVEGDPNPPSSSQKVLSIALGCGGAVLLIIALGLGACFGMAAMY